MPKQTTNYKTNKYNIIVPKSGTHLVMEKPVQQMLLFGKLNTHEYKTKIY